MFIDLKYKTGKKMPIGCDFIGGIVFKDMPMLLVRSRAYGNKYMGILDDQSIQLPQDEVIDAIYKAQLELEANREILPTYSAPEKRDKKKLHSVSLDEWTVSALRAYGNGNLSAGIREAAKLLMGGT